MSDETPTFERLARALEAEGLPELAARARRYEFDDYLSEHPTPQLELHRALLEAGRPELAARVVDGEWDGTRAESDAWAQSLEGRAMFDELAQPGEHYSEREARNAQHAATYTCRAPGCDRMPQRGVLIACARHWYQLPLLLRQDLRAEFARSGPSERYLELGQRAGEYWAMHVQAGGR